MTLFSGPAVGVIFPKTASAPDRIVYMLPYGTYNLNSFTSGKHIFVWGRTQRKNEKPKNNDFAPSIDSGSFACVQPENPDETLEVLLH